MSFDAALYQRQKLAGLCVRGKCPSYALEDSVFCGPHRDAVRAYGRGRYQTNATRRKKVNEARRNRKSRRRDMGLCVVCERPSRFYTCERCVRKERAWEGRTAVSKNSYCVLCGKRGHRWEGCEKVERLDATDYALARSGDAWDSNIVSPDLRPPEMDKAKAMRRTREKRRARGLCLRCGGEKAPNYANCAACRTQKAAGQ